MYITLTSLATPGICGLMIKQLDHTRRRHPKYEKLMKTFVFYFQIDDIQLE